MERQRLLFNSALAGALITFITYWLRELFDLLEWLPFFKAVIPPAIRGYGWNTVISTIPISLLMVLFSWIVPLPLWKWPQIKFDSSKYISWSVKQIGDEFDKIFEKCNSEGDLIIITTNFHKVYIGWVQRITRPHDKDHLRILPLISGYRRQNDKQFVITTEYTTVYAKYVREEKIKELDEMGIDIVIAREEIIFASKFDWAIYKSFSGYDLMKKAPQGKDIDDSMDSQNE